MTRAVDSPKLCPHDQILCTKPCLASRQCTICLRVKLCTSGKMCCNKKKIKTKTCQQVVLIAIVVVICSAIFCWSRTKDMERSVRDQRLSRPRQQEVLAPSGPMCDEKTQLVNHKHKRIMMSWANPGPRKIWCVSWDHSWADHKSNISSDL